MPQETFCTDYAGILGKLDALEPRQYAATRNHLNGAVSRLSPYISRGVISLRQAAAAALQRCRLYEAEKFIQELAWREYWQRVWEARDTEIFTDLRQPQAGVRHREMVTALEETRTGITVIDNGIEAFYQSGYLHNHLRLYIASLACNIAGAHWLTPSRWMYYHLLDGDLASNSLSWQWVAGSFSAKKYYCNQHNINYHSGSRQTGTCLDRDVASLAGMDLPPQLEAHQPFSAVTTLPATAPLQIRPGLPVLLYNAYQLDPRWHADTAAQRILLLEPSHYRQYPVSEKVLQFILDLRRNIPGLQVFTGEFAELVQQLPPDTELRFKRHPAFRHYQGCAEPPEWLFPEVSGYFPSFSAYWKQCSRHLKALEDALRLHN